MGTNKVWNFMVALEMNAVAWKIRNGLNVLRISLGLVFIWFGVLKFFHGISSAEVLAGNTIEKLTFGLVKPTVALPILAIWECTIGMGLITKRWLNLTLLLLYFQMAGTFLPLFFFPDQTFVRLFVPTLLGQYIIKNIVLLSGGIVIGATVRGGRITTLPTLQPKEARAQTLYGRNKKIIIKPLPPIT